MSLRLVKKNLTDRKPLWYSANGAPFYLPMGASPEGENGGSGASGGDGGSEGGNESGAGAGDGSGSTGAEGEGAAAAGAEENKGGTVSQSEYEALKARMQAADRRASEAENKIKEAERKEKTELENAQSDLAETKQQNETLAKTVSDLRLQVAFLSANEISWHDPETALSLADLSGVNIDDDGNVDKKALKSALKKLSEEKSYLVKKAEGEQQQPGGASGAPVGSGRAGTGKKTDNKTLRRKFPALASRG